jgi:hypothetical protein
MYKVILDFTLNIREFKVRRKCDEEKAAEFRRSRTQAFFSPLTTD